MNNKNFVVTDIAQTNVWKKGTISSWLEPDEDCEELDIYGIGYIWKTISGYKIFEPHTGSMVSAAAYMDDSGVTYFSTLDFGKITYMYISLNSIKSNNYFCYRVNDYDSSTKKIELPDVNSSTNTIVLKQNGNEIFLDRQWFIKILKLYHDGKIQFNSDGTITVL